MSETTKKKIAPRIFPLKMGGGGGGGGGALVSNKVKSLRTGLTTE